MDDVAKGLYQAIQAADEPRVFDEWHASSISECPKSHYMKRLGVKRYGYIGAGKMLRWQAGHLIEEVIREPLRTIYPDIRSNQRIISSTLQLTGEYDNYSEKAETIIEIKSVHDRAFKYRRKDDNRFHLRDEKPYLSHQLQNHCYVKLLRENGKPVSSILYVYITLDGRIATYKSPVLPSLLDEVDSRLRILNRAWEDQKPPKCICNDKDHPLYGSTMQYCDYKDGNECCEIKGGESAEWSEI